MLGETGVERGIRLHSQRDDARHQRRGAGGAAKCPGIVEVGKAAITRRAGAVHAGHFELTVAATARRRGDKDIAPVTTVVREDAGAGKGGHGDSVRAVLQGFLV